MLRTLTCCFVYSCSVNSFCTLTTMTHQLCLQFSLCNDSQYNDSRPQSSQPYTIRLPSGIYNTVAMSSTVGRIQLSGLYLDRRVYASITPASFANRANHSPCESEIIRLSIETRGCIHNIQRSNTHSITCIIWILIKCPSTLSSHDQRASIAEAT